MNHRSRENETCCSRRFHDLSDELLKRRRTLSGHCLMETPKSFRTKNEIKETLLNILFCDSKREAERDNTSSHFGSQVDLCQLVCLVVPRPANLNLSIDRNGKPQSANVP